MGTIGRVVDHLEEHEMLVVNLLLESTSGGHRSERINVVVRPMQRGDAPSSSGESSISKAEGSEVQRPIVLGFRTEHVPERSQFDGEILYQAIPGVDDDWRLSLGRVLGKHSSVLSVPALGAKRPISIISQDQLPQCYSILEQKRRMSEFWSFVVGKFVDYVLELYRDSCVIFVWQFDETGHRASLIRPAIDGFWEGDYKGQWSSPAGTTDSNSWWDPQENGIRNRMLASTTEPCVTSDYAKKNGYVTNSKVVIGTEASGRFLLDVFWKLPLESMRTFIDNSMQVIAREFEDLPIVSNHLIHYVSRKMIESGFSSAREQARGHESGTTSTMRVFGDLLCSNLRAWFEAENSTLFLWDNVRQRLFPFANSEGLPRQVTNAQRYGYDEYDDFVERFCYCKDEGVTGTLVDLSRYPQGVAVFDLLDERLRLQYDLPEPVLKYAKNRPTDRQAFNFLAAPITSASGELLGIIKLYRIALRKRSLSYGLLDQRLLNALSSSLSLSLRAEVERDFNIENVIPVPTPLSTEQRLRKIAELNTKISLYYSYEDFIARSRDLPDTSLSDRTDKDETIRLVAYSGQYQGIPQHRTDHKRRSIDRINSLHERLMELSKQYGIAAHTIDEAWDRATRKAITSLFLGQTPGTEVFDLADQGIPKVRSTVRLLEQIFPAFNYIPLDNETIETLICQLSGHLSEENNHQMVIESRGVDNLPALAFTSEIHHSNSTIYRILWRNNVSKMQRAFFVLHEIGHILMHLIPDSQRTKKRVTSVGESRLEFEFYPEFGSLGRGAHFERQADYFALIGLVPLSELIWRDQYDLRNSREALTAQDVFDSIVVPRWGPIEQTHLRRRVLGLLKRRLYMYRTFVDRQLSIVKEAGPYGFSGELPATTAQEFQRHFDQWPWCVLEVRSGHTEVVRAGAAFQEEFGGNGKIIGIEFEGLIHPETRERFRNLISVAKQKRSGLQCLRYSSDAIRIGYVRFWPIRSARRQRIFLLSIPRMAIGTQEATDTHGFSGQSLGVQ